MKIENFVRKEVHELPYYKAKELPLSSAADIVKLDLNENFAVERKIMKNLLLSVCKDVDVRLYPPPQGAIAVRAVSSFFGLNEEEVFVGKGSDEILDLVSKTFVKSGAKVLVVEPTFSLYGFFVKLYGGSKVDVLLKPDFELDVDKILRMNGKSSLLILCSPNNPTGNQFKRNEVETLVQEFDGLVVTDEAYADFAKYSMLNRVREFDNLIVLRTFSKAFGLAGIRAGFAASNHSVMNYIKRVAQPFSIDAVSQRLVASALQNWNYFKKRVNYVLKERKWLFQALTKIDGVFPYPSEANFILFKITREGLSSSIVEKRFQKRNVLVKDRGTFPLLWNCLRVTVGSHDMNEAFVSALKEALEE